MSNAHHIKDVAEVSNNSLLLITGGEPMLHPELVMEVVRRSRQTNPGAMIYLYSAQFTPRMDQIVSLVDGVHFTLHAAATEADVEDFQRFQKLVQCYPTKSFRLYVNCDMKLPLVILPYLWRRVEIKPWLTEAECQLPPNEVLYILDR